MNAATIESPSQKPLVRNPGDGEAIWFLDNLLTIKTCGRDDSRFSLMENAMPAGSHTPYHLHQHEDEAFYVLEGTLTVFVDGEAVVATPGMFIHIPAGTPHGFRTETAVRMLVICVGDGFFEMVREAGSPAERRELPPVVPPDKERLGAVCAQHGIEILGPLPH